MFKQLPILTKSNYKCEKCNKTYDILDSYQKHLRTVHGKYQRKKKAKCLEIGCSKIFFSIKELRNHLKEDHRIDIVVDIQQFSSKTQFMAWKEQFEQNHIERFVKFTGTKESIRADEVSRTTFKCHCTGFEKKKNYDDLDKTRNKKGS